MSLSPFAILVPDRESIKLTCFFYAADAEELEEFRSFFFSSFELDREEDIISGETDKTAHYDSAFDETEIVFVRYLVKNASAACGLSCYGDVLRITAECGDVLINPVKACFLV